MAKVKIEQEYLKSLEIDAKRLSEALSLINQIENMSEDSYHIDPGFQSILRLIRDWNRTWNK